MRFARFFIDRPIFAAVVSIVIFLVGAIAVWQLPISQYPEVVPPSVQVRAQYPGANPKVIAETVAAPLEQEINGVENMLYMSSQATSDGTMLLTITFRLGTDVDNAQVQVQNRVAQALPRLPEDVRRVGVTTKKASPDLLMVVHLTSPEGRYDTVYLRNYATLQVRDVLARLPGMGEVRLFGAGDYSMRVWLDPERIASRGLTAGDVVRAIREQNVQVAAGGNHVVPAARVDHEFLGGTDIEAEGRRVDTIGAHARAIGGDGEDFRAIAAVDLRGVDAGAALEQVAVVAWIPDHAVIAGFTENLVVTVAAGQRVVAGTTEQKIGAAAADEHVVAALAEQKIRARTAGDRVVAGAAEQLRGGQRAVRLVERERVVAAQAEALHQTGIGDGRLAAQDRDRATIDQDVFGCIGAEGDRVIEGVADRIQQTSVGIE
jgi:multidrug efflux pump subunit AcrB